MPRRRPRSSSTSRPRTGPPLSSASPEASTQLSGLWRTPVDTERVRVGIDRGGAGRRPTFRGRVGRGAVLDFGDSSDRAQAARRNGIDPGLGISLQAPIEESPTYSERADPSPTLPTLTARGAGHAWRCPPGIEAAWDRSLARLRVLRRIGGSAVSLALLGCDGGEDATVSPPPAGRDAPAREPVEISLEAMALRHEGLIEDDARSQWDSERLGSLADDRLAQIGWAIAGRTDAADLPAGRFAADFVSTPWRPAALGTVFTQGALRVRRPPGELPAPDPISAAPGALIRGLRQPLDGLGAAEVRVKFKVFRVEREGAVLSTSARFELAASGPAGRLQQTARWDCRWELAGDGLRLRSVDVRDFEECVSARGFVDCTEAAVGGIASFREQLAYGTDHWLARIEHRLFFGPSGWQGLAIGDADGDGRDDLYIPQPGGLPNRLYIQREDGTLADRSREAGVDWRDHSHGALFVDLDNDGDQDLVVAVIYGLLFLENDGAGKFAVAASRLLPEAMPYSLAAADFDNDADLDLYVCCYSLRGSAAENRFLARPVPYHDAENGGRNVLYRNDRGFRFTDVTEPLGLDQGNRRFSFAAAWEDDDLDGDLDLYVANDFGRNNLYRQEGGRFTDAAAEAGVEDMSAGMSVAWGDADGDGRMDLYVSNMWSSAGNRVTYQRRFAKDDLEGFRRHARGNSLFQNAGGGVFEDVSLESGASMGRWAWGSRFADLNNDGWQDLVVANGYITQRDPDDL